MGKKMETIDPEGRQLNVTTDYDVMLNAPRTTYPVALDASPSTATGRALEDLKADFDKRVVKITRVARRAQGEADEEVGRSPTRGPRNSGRPPPAPRRDAH